MNFFSKIIEINKKKFKGLIAQTEINGDKVIFLKPQKYMNLSCVQTVYHWLDGTSIPSIDNLYALSSLFKMPMDALVCGNRPSIILPHDEDFFMRALSYYMRISDMQAA